MSVFKTVGDFLIYSNVWISLGAVSCGILFFEVFNLPINIQFIGFVFFATFFTYNFQRLVKLQLGKGALSGIRLEWLKANQTLITILTVLALVFGAILGGEYILVTWPLMIPIGFFSFFYIWKLPFTNYNLRSIPTLKIYLVTLTWALTTAILPNLLFRNNVYDRQFLWFVISLFIYVLAITIPFDIRDLDKDELEKKTIPQLLGVNKSIGLAMGLYLLGHIGFSMAIGHYGFGLALNLGLGLSLLWLTKPNRSDRFFTGLMDGLLITILLFYYLN